ncbi:MAG: hypothetical protein ACO3DK_02530 [Bacteroidia bacterium]
MKWIRSTALMALLTGIISLAQAQTTVPAYIDTDQWWTAAGSPYQLSANTYLAEGAFIRIQPGVRVEASKPLQFIVDGRIEAAGKPDSMIEFEGFQWRLQAKAAGYEPTSDTGAQFNYCHFFGQSNSGTYNIYNECPGVSVTHCLFEDAYYGLYNRYSSAKGYISVTHSRFPSNSKYGYPIYTSGQGRLVLEFDTFQNQYAVYGYGTDIAFNRNQISGTGSVTLSVYGSLNMACNDFKNMASGLQLNCWGYYDTLHMTVTGNTLDSCGGSFYPMLSLSGSTPDGNKPILAHFNRNNFMRYSGTGAKVKFTGTNKNPAAGWAFDFSSNYWMSQDSATIAAWIQDYHDDLMIWGLAQASNPLGSLVVDCQDNTAGQNSSVGFAVSAYPNPSQGNVLWVDCPGGFDAYTWINAQGQILQHQTGTFSEHCELIWPEMTSSGLYHLVLHSGHQRISLRLLRP